MDTSHFDSLIRSLTATTSRRNMVASWLGIAFASLVNFESEEATAKKRKKKKKKNQGQVSPPPPPPPPSPPTREVVTRTFTNAAAITIPGSGSGSSSGSPASPYPSTITVSGLTNGIITDLNVHLNGFDHEFPVDVDMLLAATHLSGLNALIMSDVGTSSTNANLVLDDQAAASLPSSGNIGSGTFKPTNFGPGTDTFPSPAPTPTGNSLLSAFNGQDPNGIWQLFIVDDAGGDIGLINNGWALEISAEVDAPAGALARAAVPATPRQRKQRQRRMSRGSRH